MPFIAFNEMWLPKSEDEQYDFVISIADGSLVDVDQMAKMLSGWAVAMN